MEFKTLIFFGLLAVALGFTLPEEQQQFDGSYAFGVPEREYQQQTLDGDKVVSETLARSPRSPQRRFEGSYQHSRQHGSSASLGYTHPINKNWEAYASGSRNFRYNDNSAHAGLRFKF